MGDNLLERRTAEKCCAAVAVIGLACWLPGADDPDAFWEVLSEVADAIPPLPHAPWPTPRDQRARDGGSYGAGEFAAATSGTSAPELAALDPGRRLVVELGLAALQDAGMSPEALRGTETAMFLGGDQALGLAYQSLRSGAARLVLADGVHLDPALERMLGVANGSAGVAVLKRLADAVADGDVVYYVLVGSMSGCDGATPTVPDTATQQALLRAAYAGDDRADLIAGIGCGRPYPDVVLGAPAKDVIAVARRSGT
ncbi:hypothetical protein OG203_43090 [Nocardia sp. NBC_01499]|uniref:beta-ketoacyl synthase N-terminal-like domain-containing protein n=1 Tax=Nocardia sp. NBC_01499 TaxID=2903597 RepID=UPI00386BAC9B